MVLEFVALSDIKRLYSERSMRSKTRRAENGEKGQIIVEYVLLLIVATTVASLIINTMVSRAEESPGFLVRKWDQILRFIGSDTPDDISREE